MQKKKKVIHLLYSGLGGHGSVFFSLVKADKENSVPTEAVFCGIEDVREDYTRQCNEKGIKYTAIKKKPGLDIGTYFDVYHAFKKSKPGTIVLHGSSFIIPARLYKLFNPGTRLLVRETQAHHLKTERDWFWLKLATRFCDHIIFLTRESLEGASHRLDQKRILRKAVIIPNGIDTDSYKPVLKGDMSKTIILGMQSRLQKIKDHKTLLRAFAILKNRAPHRKLLLRIAGDGETMAELKAMAAQLGIGNEVEFCGMLNEKELHEFMNSLHIYVHATLGETMSNSIMQAMACGLPVIASDVWGVNNMIVNGGDGLLFKSENAEDLSRAIDEVVSNDVLREKISVNARTTAIQKYSHYRLLENYMRLYGPDDQAGAK
jgi:glycosyltransferase involved in cell wall biosynthesis